MRQRRHRNPFVRILSFALLLALLTGLGPAPTRALPAGALSLPAAADTYVASGKPGQSFGSKASVAVGYDGPGGYGEERALLAFDAAALPAGSRVTQALLTLHVSSYPRGDAPLRIEAYRVRSGWSESVTWQGQLGLAVAGVPAAHVDAPAALGAVTFELTGALQEWSDARDSAQFSLLLQSDATSGWRERGFWARECAAAQCGENRPRLEVEYEPPAADPPLTAQMTVSEAPVGKLLYTVTVKNPSGKTASEVVVAAPVPDKMVFVSATNGGVAVGREVRWNVGALAGGATWTGSYVVGLVPIPAIEAAPAKSPGAMPEMTTAAGISITKLPDTQIIDAGGTATFDITVRNTGDVALTDVLVTDPKGPACNPMIGALSPGQTYSFQCKVVYIIDSFTNVASVSGKTSTGQTVSASDSADVTVSSSNAVISIDQTPATQITLYGEQARFDISVKNTGDVPLSNVVVNDAEVPDCNRAIGSLDPGVSFPTYQCVKTNVTAAFTNVATVTGTPPTGSNVSASDTASVSVMNDWLTLSATPDVQQITVGGTAYFDITLSSLNVNVMSDTVISDPLAPDCNRSLGFFGGGSYTYRCSKTNITDDFTNKATVSGRTMDGTDVSASDTVTVDVIHPALTISKSPDVQQVLSGGTATFTIDVENTGDVSLTSVKVDDALAPGCSKTIGALTPNQTSSYTCTLANITADMTNSATVTGTPPVGSNVTATDTAAVDVIHPALSINKTPDTQTVTMGATATFKVSVKNIGDVALTNVVVSDPVAPGCNKTIGNLAAGATAAEISCSVPNVHAGFTNTAGVSGKTPLGGSIGASDTAQVKVAGNTLGLDVKPATQMVPAGQTATFTVTVSNTGATTLQNVAVWDDLAPGCIRAIGMLTAGQSYGPYNCSRSGVMEDFENLIIVTGTPPGSTEDIAVTQGAGVDVIHPALTINKTPDMQTVYTGETAAFKINVKNTGDVALTSVAVVDPLAPDCNRDIGTLAPGQSAAEIACSMTGVAGSFTNTATVSGAPPVGAGVTASDSAEVIVAAPAGLSIQKTADIPTIWPGGTAWFTIQVRNTGDVTLTDVLVNDPLSPDCNKAIGSLAAGLTASYTCQQGGVTAAFTNEATVTGKTPTGGTVTKSSAARVDVRWPRIVNGGAVVTWKYPGDGSTRSAASGAVIFPAQGVWLPLMMR